MLGTNVNRWQLWSSTGQNPWVRLSERVSRKPLAAVLLTTFPLLLLSAPALALDTGPPNVENLPPDNASRKSFEAFQRDRGAGWATPFEVDFQTEGPITTEARLRRLKRFQNDAARLPGIEAVLGPASLLERTAVLRRLTRQIVVGRPPAGAVWRAASSGCWSATGRLNRGLEQGAAGAGELNAGLGQAAAGSDEIAQGTERRGAPDPASWPTAFPGRARVPTASSAAARRASRGARELDDAIDELTRVIVRAGRRRRVAADRPGEQRPVGGPVGAAQPRQRRAGGGRRSRRGSVRVPTCSGRSPRSGH